MVSWNSQWLVSRSDLGGAEPAPSGSVFTCPRSSQKCPSRSESWPTAEQSGKLRDLFAKHGGKRGYLDWIAGDMGGGMKAAQVPACERSSLASL